MNLDIAQQCIPSCFSDTYLEARTKFLQAAPASRAYMCSAKGPSGKDLFTDVAYFGPQMPSGSWSWFPPRTAPKVIPAPRHNLYSWESSSTRCYRLRQRCSLFMLSIVTDFLGTAE